MPEFYLPARLSTRPAKSDDRDDIGRFLKEMLGKFGLDLDHYGTDRDIVELPVSYEGGYFGLIEEGGVIQGTFALYPIDETRAEVRKMYLHPSLRGRGLGKQLLEHILSIAGASGFEILQLETSSKMIAARKLYESYGFMEVDADKKTDRCDRLYVKHLK